MLGNKEKIIPTKQRLHLRIENFAKEIGFDLVGFSPAHLDPKYLDAYKKWLRKGFHADMTYMKKSATRADLTKILPGAKSVIVLGLNYYYEQSPLKKECARIARYAYGRDYHKILGKMLKKLEKYIQSLTVPHALAQTTRSYTDTGPILERAFAEQAGLGWIGKNSCLITREFGSWVFLGIVITTLDLKNATRGDPKIPNSPLLRSELPPSLCGNCTRCIDACPTKAIIAPGVINANRCIAYQTIENKGRIPADLTKIIKKERRIFGCDICQEVCPHNIARQKPHPLLQKIAGDQLNLKELKKIHSDKTFLQTFAGSPLMRAKRKGLIRTV